MVYYIAAIVFVAFIFDFINGFHDSANSIATIVGTRVLSPLAAVIWAACFNFAALFTVGTAVAKAVSKGFVDSNIVTPNVILGGLIGAIIWNLVTWFYGIPSSSSHALIGGYAGADDRGDGVRRVVEAVDEVENESDQNDRRDVVDHYAFFRAMLCSTLPTSSHWSSASSSLS